ncbi:MAG: hypothetical protein NTY20_00470 [Candidatus Aenigmarchaeota archaeon]|nr:hypothetical protein [Candidatus Aenigmarchaeota archaeon]
MEKLQFTIETDYFHILPTQKFLIELIEASTETRSIIGLEIPYKWLSEYTGDISAYTITGRRTERLVDMTRDLVNVKKGESISLIFDDSVSVDYINNFKGKIEQLFK